MKNSDKLTIEIDYFTGTERFKSFKCGGREYFEGDVITIENGQFTFEASIIGTFTFKNKICLTVYNSFVGAYCHVNMFLDDDNCVYGTLIDEDFFNQDVYIEN